MFLSIYECVFFTGNSFGNSKITLHTEYNTLQQTEILGMLTIGKYGSIERRCCL